MRLPVGTRHPLVLNTPPASLGGFALFPFWMIPAGIGWVWTAFRFYHRKSWRWRAGIRLVDKLQGFEGPNREARIIGYLRKVDPLVFEEAILEAYRRKGVPILRNARYSGDGGIDGRLFMGGRKVIVQAKRYGGAINPRHVTDFAHVLEREGAAGGLFVHTGRTGGMSRDAISSSRVEIRFVSGEKLVKLMTRE